MVNKKECLHKWVKTYYRKQVGVKKYQSWFTLKNVYFCIKCKEVKKLN